MFIHSMVQCTQCLMVGGVSVFLCRGTKVTQVFLEWTERKGREETLVSRVKRETEE
ncbi:hypothetical protein JZ751_010901 [Albula glossodonta]|uniref:Uncharacterized protein n=1 Tax=Albula glossodonta TaxID=121402 RepID=A0A8T2P3N4_9TELE|nr:hypothetical protein JZ751_010901 [Albula glossodonta]